jgi:parvulin-like peptidyl-prolyl isomerase
MRWSRAPVVHFAVIGAALFTVKTFAFDAARPVLAAAAAEPAVISDARIEDLRSDWLARTGMLPDEREIEALIQAEIDDEALIAEARQRGVHRNDPVVQRRLLRNMRFLEGESERSAEELLAEAYRLRMDRSDLVVRRRLIQKLQLEIFGAARAAAPSEAELAAYLQRHAERFTQPARVRLTHVFLSRDRRGAAIDADAEALFAQLLRDDVATAEAGGLGDPFLFPRDLPPRSERELAKLFGPEFAAQALTLPPGRWAGPVPSAYGRHLVWIHARTPAVLSRLDAVRSEVREALLAERGERMLREYVGELRERHPVRVEHPRGPGGGAG